MKAHDPNCPTALKRSRVAVCTKDGRIGMIALGCTETVFVVSMYDPRLDPQPVRHKAFETADAAELWFTEYVIATVTENGWSLGYTGPRNFG